MRNALSASPSSNTGATCRSSTENTPGGRLLDLLDASSGTPAISTVAQENAADEILDIGVATVGPDRRDVRMRWDYELLFEEHRVIVLDTRTWRGFPQGASPVTDEEALEAGAPELVGCRLGPRSARGRS